MGIQHKKCNTNFNSSPYTKKEKIVTTLTKRVRSTYLEKLTTDEGNQQSK